jgi:nitrate/nitrite-specific signal transduction histidine kinase
LARINLLNWFNNGLLARLLHGPIQNSLHASVIRLKDAQSNISIEKILEDLRQRILDVTHQLGESPTHHSLREQLNDIGLVWQSISNVSFTLDHQAEERLKLDIPASAIMSDLALEVCSNAIRHGGAQNVSLYISSNAREIKLTVEDDGKPREPGKSVGVGSRFVDTCSTSWKYKRVGSKNRLVVGIPSEALNAAVTS